MSLFPLGSNESDIERVYREAHGETRIEYSKTGGFFGPNLRNLNHLEVGRSKIINCWVTRLGERLLVIYQRTVEWLKDLIRSIYPRRIVIYGRRKDAYVTAKLTFSKRDDHAVPMHNMHCQFWARTYLGGWRVFSSGWSDRDGVVKLEFDFLESRRRCYHSFHFEIHQIEHVFFDSTTQEAKTKFEVFERVKVPKGDLTGMGYDLGNLQLHYWEYRRDADFPRVVIKDHDEDAPEYYSDGRNDAIQQQFIPIELTKDKHLAQIALDPDSLSIPEIQRDYPKNLTVAMEEKLPGSTRCNYRFGRRMMNGMN